MYSKRLNIIIQILGLLFICAMASCGGMEQNNILSDESATQVNLPTTSSLGGTDAGTPPITIVISRGIAGTLGENATQPDTIVLTDIFGNVESVSVEPQTGAVFAISLAETDDPQIFEMTFLKDDLEIGALQNDNGQLDLDPKYFLVSLSGDAVVSLGDVTLSEGAQFPVSQQMDIDNDGINDHDDTQQSCVPPAVAVEKDLYNELMNQICDSVIDPTGRPDVRDGEPALNLSVDPGMFPINF